MPGGGELGVRPPHPFDRLSMISVFSRADAATASSICARKRRKSVAGECFSADEADEPRRDDVPDRLQLSVSFVEEPHHLVAA